MIEGVLAESEELLADLELGHLTLKGFDAALLLQIADQQRERDYWLRVWTEQLGRWRLQKPTPQQRALLERLDAEVQASKPVVVRVLEVTRHLAQLYVEQGQRRDMPMVQGALALGRFTLLEN